jgi:hypothetical protein
MWKALVYLNIYWFKLNIVCGFEFLVYTYVYLYVYIYYMCVYTRIYMYVYIS